MLGGLALFQAAGRSSRLMPASTARQASHQEAHDDRPLFQRPIRSLSPEDVLALGRQWTKKNTPCVDLTKRQSAEKLRGKRHVKKLKRRLHKAWLAANPGASLPEPEPTPGGGGTQPAKPRKRSTRHGESRDVGPSAGPTPTNRGKGMHRRPNSDRRARSADFMAFDGGAAVAMDADLYSGNMLVRFPSEDAYFAAQAAEAPEEPVETEVPEMGLLAVREPKDDRSADRFGDWAERMKRDYGAIIRPEEQYQIEDEHLLVGIPDLEPDQYMHEHHESARGTLADVLRMIGADKAHARTRGEGVTIAVVDTGVHGGHGDVFPQSRRHAGSGYDTPWEDTRGHGTMCAAIAAGEPGSRLLPSGGVAPGARIMPCRTRFFEAELIQIFLGLARAAAHGERIVASCSFGLRTGSPPPDPADRPLEEAMEKALQNQVVICFSAGNNHQLAGGGGGECHPNTIWRHKSRDDIITAATCDLDSAMWYYSSRGPGQRNQGNGIRKPDVTAPTPRDGLILYGDGLRVMPNGWGTSGACPQVAGLAALLLSLDKTMTPPDVKQSIEAMARPIGGVGDLCQGRGLIDCWSAVSGRA